MCDPPPLHSAPSLMVVLSAFFDRSSKITYTYINTFKKGGLIMLHSTYLNHHENPSEEHRQKGGAIYSLVSIGVMAALTCVLSTGGFLIGYIPFALISGLLIDLATSKKITRKSTSILLQIGGMVLGLLVLYVFGTIWFLFRYAESTSFFAALKLCVIPFIPFDLLKILIAYFLGGTLRARLMQAGYLP